MGMYDRIKCELPLPDGWEPDELQTKDFDCLMEQHVITKTGRLLFYNRSEKLVDANFHGDVNFYGINPADKKWHEYTARFTDGQLVTISVVIE